MEPVALLEQYFKCLESGDFAGAAICFSESARYSHPPYADDPPAAGRHEAHGREEILALFHRRGLRTTRHVIDTVARSGARFFISGVVHEAGGSLVASFLSEALFDPDTGMFTEYVAYSSRPAVWHEASGS